MNQSQTDISDTRNRFIINVTGSIVAFAMIGMFWFLLVELFRVPVPSANHDVLLVVIGVLLREVGNITSYFYTGDANSRKQSDTIANQAKTIQQNVKSSTDTIVLQPGDSTTSNTTDSGTTIHKE